jgi:ribosomal protein L12E/L44/L45/RPP1/RPP2
MLKTILATVIAGAFLTSMPLLASANDEKPAGEKAEKAGKKKEKKEEGKKDEKAGAGW